MRWSDRRTDEQVAEASLWFWVFLGVCAIVGLLASSIVQAQTFYSTEEGSGMAFEIMPGLTYFSGPRSGLAVETIPGVTHYNLHDADLNVSRGTLYDLRPDRGADRPILPRAERNGSQYERESFLNPAPFSQTGRR